MLQSWKELLEINRMSTRWDQYEALKQHKKERQHRQRATRRHCFGCGCVLYVRGPHDLVDDEKDLDEVFPDLSNHPLHRVRVQCFRCHSMNGGGHACKPQWVEPDLRNGPGWDTKVSLERWLTQLAILKEKGLF
jgi:hypothetical protein